MSLGGIGGGTHAPIVSVVDQGANHPAEVAPGHHVRVHSAEFTINGSPVEVRVTPAALQLFAPVPKRSHLGDYRDLVCVVGALACIVSGLVVRSPLPWLGWALIGVGALLLLVPLTTAIGQLLTLVVGGAQLVGSLLTRGRGHRPAGNGRRTQGQHNPWASTRTVPLTDLNVGPLRDRGRPSFVVETPDGPLTVVGSRRRRAELRELHRSLVSARPPH